MNWGNVFKILEKYTQIKHYSSIFDDYGIRRTNSRYAMATKLHENASNDGLLDPVIPLSKVKEWLDIHQINGNNYTFVYNLQEPIIEGLLENIYVNRNEHIEINLWDINPENDFGNLQEVMPNLNDILLTGIHRDHDSSSYIFSFIAPCVVTGTPDDGPQRLFKKMFFCHAVFFEKSNDVKVIFNPTANLQHVNNTRENKNDWTPIANMIFDKVKEYVGDVYIIAPNWIPEALYQFAEEATKHNNPEITEASFKAETMIQDFAEDLIKVAGEEAAKEPALVNRLIQDIQMSFESQLMEIFKPEDEEDEYFTIFKQRSDGVTHIISVESTDEGLRAGAAAQIARRSRQDGNIDLLGVNLKKGERTYKFLVEQGTDAYLIRGTNTFIEERVVNIVIRELNEYREEIQLTTQGD